MKFKDLPRNWREEAIALSESAAEGFRWRPKMRREIILDDDCPVETSVVIIDERGRVFRLKDGELSERIKKSLGRPAILAASLYSLPPLPKTQKASFNLN
jgi:hypothetical protein